MSTEDSRCHCSWRVERDRFEKNSAHRADVNADATTCLDWTSRHGARVMERRRRPRGASLAGMMKPQLAPCERHRQHDRPARFYLNMRASEFVKVTASERVRRTQDTTSTRSLESRGSGSALEPPGLCARYVVALNKVDLCRNASFLVRCSIRVCSSKCALCVSSCTRANYM